MSRRIKAFHGDTIPINRSGLIGFDGQPIADLSTWSLTLTVKATLDDADPGVLQKTKSAGQITTTGGEMSVEISALESRTLFLPGVIYRYDIEGIDSNGRVKTLEIGVISLKRDTTTTAFVLTLFDSLTGNFDDLPGNFDDL